MSSWFYRWRIRLLLWLSPPRLFQRLSELDWYGGLLREWANPASSQPNQRLLDVGCASGFLAGFLHQQGHRVSGVDSSQAMIAYARRACPGVDFQQADALQLPFANAEFDQVFCASLLNVVDDPARLIDELQRVTRGGGRIHFLLPQTGFDERDFQTLERRLNLTGFSRAALQSWHALARKKSREESMALLQAAGLETELEASRLDGMLLSISTIKPQPSDVAPTQL